MNCPACGYYNPEGATTCFHCSLALPVSVSADAFCARHADVKATGACSRCGTFGCGECLTQRGTDWLCPACVARQNVLPWDERESLGLWRAWWRTSVAMISNPTQTLEGAQPDAPLGSSLVFAMLSGLVGFATTVLVYGGIGGMAFLVSLKRASGGDAIGLAALAGLFVFYVVALFLGQLMSLFLVSGLDHLMLMMLGANPRPYTVSVRAQALSMGPYLLGLIPVCGMYVFPLWSMVLRIVALMHFHKTSAGKATVAVLAPLVLFCGLGMFVYLAAIGLAAGLAR